MSEFCSSFIIYARSYKETSLLLDVFTQEYGRLCVIANGAKKHTHKFGSPLQPFYLNNLKFAGKNDLQILQAVEPITYYDLGNNNICGLYLNELLYRVLPRHDPCLQLFTSYCTTIASLAKSDCPQKALRLFEKQVLVTLGYGLDFSKIVRDSFYIYRLHDGFQEVISGIPNTISGYALLSFANQLDDQMYHENSDRILHEIKSLMRMVLNYHLGKKRLFSKEVLI